MNIVLLNPPLRIDPKNVASGIAMPPLWIAYIGGVLKNMNLPYSVVDAVGLALNQKFSMAGGFWRGLNFQQILERIPPETDVICLSCMFTSSWPLLRELLQFLHGNRPSALLVLGGEHPSADTSRVFEESPVDIVVVGEGEETTRVLFEKLNKQKIENGIKELDWAGTSGLWWRSKDRKVHEEKRRSRIKEINTIPEPAWDQVPVKDYMTLGKGHGANRGPFMPMLATRGCPYQCTFCASKSMWTTTWIPRNPKSVVAEMVRYNREFGATDFHFVDLTFVIKKQWAKEFSKEILEKGLKITWQLPGGTRAEAIDEELAEIMARSGLSNMSFAIESGSEETLAQTKKNLNLKKQMDAARAARKAGIRLFGFFIIGFPGESKKDLWLTFLMVFRAAWLGYHEINISGFAPIPGTEDFRKLVAEGKLTINEDYYHDLFNWATIGKQKSYNSNLSDKQLRLLILGGLLSFFVSSWVLRPWRFLGELVDLTRGKNARGKLIRFIKSTKELENLKVVSAR